MTSERRKHFRTHSGIELKTAFTPEDLGELFPDQALGAPGEYPFSRGV